MKFKYLPFLLICCFLIPSCGGKQDNDNDQDSLGIDSDSVFIDTIDTDEVPVAAPPKKADELFDDFVYAFMHNKKFQRSRVNFPLKNVEDSVNRPIDYKHWVHDPLYSGRELYMTVSTSRKAAAVSKDTSINTVKVQEINPSSHKVKQYSFERENSEWRLKEINHGDVSSMDESSEFMTFYCRFCTDTEYQNSHINNVVEVNTFNDLEGRHVKGTITSEQWNDFAPELPKDEIMCVRYGDKKAEKSSLRIVNIASPSGDAGVCMTFKKKDGEWKLTGYEN